MASTESGEGGEDSHEELYENAPCGHLSTLPGGEIILVNQTFLRSTGYQRHDLIGARRFQDLLSVGSRIYHETHYLPLLLMQEEVREVAVEIVGASGERLPFLINSVLKRHPTGGPRLIRTALFRASDRRQYEKELLLARKRAEEASRAKAAFVSMVSHEIRTPLNGIQGLSRILGTTELSAEQQRLVQMLTVSTESLMSLIEDVLDFSKIESNSIVLEARVFDLRKLTGAVLQTLALRASNKGVALEARIEEQVASHVVGDEVKIGQILTNLLGNAVKFTHQGSVLLIVSAVSAVSTKEAEPRRQALEFRIEDTGIGIAPAHLPHIFEDFAQASHEISVKYGGTGLGLAISKRLIALHGGTLAVESELGRGTVFSFTIDFRLPEEPWEPEPQPLRADARTLAGLRVLIADDNEVNVLVLSAYLESWGIACDVASDGHQALDRALSSDYDVILMDLRMPGLDGYGAARAIRALPEGRRARVPIIAVSASVRVDQQDEMAEAGFDDFVGKPIHPDRLFEKIARLTQRC